MRRKLQVFVSSTFADLQSERQAAVAAILKSGHIPAGMELFTAGDKSQMEVIRRWIDESDAYMLILGGRYGSIESSTGLSYTELEFDYASEKSKPLFSVVIDETALEARVKSRGTAVFETENPKLLKQFREKVLGKMSSFFSDEKDVRLAVYESLGDMGARAEVVGWVPASEVTRVEELAAENAELKAENARLQAATQPKKLAKPNENDEELLELARTLRDIEVKIPEEVQTDETVKALDLFTLFIRNSDALIAGVTNSPLNDAGSDFMYYNVATKLKVHGLMGDKRLVGKKLSCLATTPLGDRMLAWWDKRMVANKRKKKDE